MRIFAFYLKTYNLNKNRNENEPTYRGMCTQFQ